MRVTASRLPLLRSCLWWATDEAVWNEGASKSAEMGNAFHEAMFANLMGGKPVGLWTKWFTDRAGFAYRWLDEHRHIPMLGEVALALNPAKGTARALGINIGRKYKEHGSTDDELCCSLDIMHYDGFTVSVDDWKSGQFVGDEVWHQLRGQGVAAMLVTGAEQARLRVLHATPEGVKERVQYMDIPAMQAELDAIAKRLEGIEDSWPTPSAACDDSYCPARDNCKAYQATKQRSA